jgi:hypothetical protein
VPIILAYVQLSDLLPALNASEVAFRTVNYLLTPVVSHESVDWS